MLFGDSYCQGRLFYKNMYRKMFEAFTFTKKLPANETKSDTSADISINADDAEIAETFEHPTFFNNFPIQSNNIQNQPVRMSSNLRSKFRNQNQNQNRIPLPHYIHGNAGQKLPMQPNRLSSGWNQVGGSRLRQYPLAGAAMQRNSYSVRTPSLPFPTDLAICPDILMSILIAGAAAAVVFLNATIVGIGRRKRSSPARTRHGVERGRSVCRGRAGDTNGWSVSLVQKY